MSRLYCSCVFTNTFAEIDNAFTNFQKSTSAEKYKEAVKQAQKIVGLLKESHEKHLEKHNFDALRSTLELRKLEAINANFEPIQTNAWKPGDLKRLRMPDKKRSKKDEANRKKKAKIASTQQKTKKMKGAPPPVGGNGVESGK